MTADIVFTDGTNALTLSIESWSYDIQRLPKIFSLKGIPSLGVPSAVFTDFGSYTEQYTFNGFVTSRATAKNLQSYSRKEWWESGKGNPLSITIPALTGDDDAVDIKPSGSNADPMNTYLKIWQDLDTTGATIYRFTMRVAVARRL
jgi:hypothetical protein